MSDAHAFAPTANPAGYVPSAGSERALGELQRWALASREPVCVLRGPPGMGKTLLLKLLAARVRGAFEVAFVPHPDCDPDGVCRVVLSALGAEPAADPRVGLARALEARRPHGGRLLIAIDEADFLPRETASWLVELAASSGGAVRALLAMTDGTERLGPAAELGGRSETVRLDAAMSRPELEAYVHRELERARVDRAVCEQFDPSALAELHARSGGVPGALRREATRILFRAELAGGADAALRALPTDARAEPPTDVCSEPPPGVRAEPPALAPAPAEPITLVAAPVPPASRPQPTLRYAAALGVAALGVAACAALGFWLAVFSLADRVAPQAPAAVATGSHSAPRDAPTAPRVDVAAAPRPAGPPATVATAPPPTPTPASPALAPVFVNVNATPWAEIELDGRAVGETPIARLAVAPGRHRLAARMPDGRVLERELDIRESGSRVVFP